TYAHFISKFKPGTTFKYLFIYKNVDQSPELLLQMFRQLLGVGNIRLQYCLPRIGKVLFHEPASAPCLKTKHEIGGSYILILKVPLYWRSSSRFISCSLISW